MTDSVNAVDIRVLLHFIACNVCRVNVRGVINTFCILGCDFLIQRWNIKMLHSNKRLEPPLCQENTPFQYKDLTGGDALPLHYSPQAVVDD